MAVMTLSWRILALILVTFIAPWILRDHAGKGITSADAVLSTSMIAESRSVMKNASVVNVKKDLVGEYWGKPTKPQNSRNTDPIDTIIQGPPPLSSFTFGLQIHPAQPPQGGASWKKAQERSTGQRLQGACLNSFKRTVGEEFKAAVKHRG